MSPSQSQYTPYPLYLRDTPIRDTSEISEKIKRHEAPFAKILCDVAYSKILLCATSHKIFANGAYSVASSIVTISKGALFFIKKLVLKMDFVFY